ncbi:MAG: phosphoribosylanthranilate isomerase [Flavobacteriaceae bacterium]|jgi:phosphoribosylanthranilate isomerase|nr:phosphoribosylanthranilate isomerase [Flavobacteriaceae bacterium]MBT4298341.1 phosphoribosylanthranilate isomerase [Flavobacteriaceae bacterium]MBT4960941.1 phosphoribosylanthranilate isomerase [Flavobacteriaceae bacterium]MBT5232786.1 phosphoribosylanthranilate isomerase [Flavobacteriaceae bacterium]MBT5492974.1 phosphoribosylanthranilate isomerase [Flavobacteriaceae bacterium]|tara:strand:- start:2904 stop:3506 length:603 start_codon:yes stop_codon:yes gene_type:complete
MKLKVCGMKFSENISEIESLKPDFMGFIFYKKSKRFFNESKLILNDKINRVGVFVNQEINEVIDNIKKYKLDYVQLHGEEDVRYCLSIKSICKVIKVFKIDDTFNFDKVKKFENVSDYYLFDTKTNLHGGSGKKFNWEILKNYNSKKYFFLSGGISENDIEEIKKIRKIYPIIGIDINSKFELPNLKKDRAKIKSLIDKI